MKDKHAGTASFRSAAAPLQPSGNAAAPDRQIGQNGQNNLCNLSSRRPLLLECPVRHPAKLSPLVERFHWFCASFARVSVPGM